METIKQKHVPAQPKETKIFKSGEIAPVSGNYRFEKHESDVPDCLPRWGAYLHLIKGMKIPLHDECLQPSLWSLMTVTDENPETMLKR